MVCTAPYLNNNSGSYPNVYYDYIQWIENQNTSGNHTAVSWIAPDETGGGGYAPEPSETEEIIIDDSFENTKAECVYLKLMSLSGGFKKAIQKFDGEFPVSHLRFKVDYNMPHNEKKGYAQPPVAYIIDIVINGNPNMDASFYNRPNLLVAKTIVHEVIHAEMFRKMISLANKDGRIDVVKLKTMLQNGDYPGILDYYTRYGQNDFQHIQMSAHYRNTIADALQSFDNNQHSLQFYMDLAWEGLIYSNDPTWLRLSASEKQRIQNVIKNYIMQNKNEDCF